MAFCVFNTMAPKDLTDPEERAMAERMFGGMVDIPEGAKRTVCLRLGRGSGWSFLSAAFAIYRAVTAQFKVGPGDIPTVITVAPDKETAALSIRMARELMDGVPSLAKLIETGDKYYIQIRRPDKKRVLIEAKAAARGGRTARGRTILSFILDEAEFFGVADEARAVNDKDVYRAIMARMKFRDGRAILISTPWAPNTLMAELFEKNFGEPRTCVAALATTEMMRGDDPETVQMIAEEREKDPENAAREFDCDTSFLGELSFFDHGSIMESKKPYEPLEFDTSKVYVAAADFGFRQDSSSLCIVESDGKVYRVARYLELRPRPGKPLVPSEVVRQFAAICREYGLRWVVSDGHYREAIVEHLSTHGLGLVDAPGGSTGKMEVYTRARAVLHQGLAVLPDDRKFIQQMKEITSKLSANGLIHIRSPRKAGSGHGDMVSSWVLAIHKLAHRKPGKRDEQPEWGTPEWVSWEARRALSREQQWDRDSIRRETISDARKRGDFELAESMEEGGMFF